MDLPRESLKKELVLAVLESRLEGSSVGQIARLIGKSDSFVRGILRSEALQKALKEAKERLEKDTEDLYYRESLMKENSSEIMLEALSGELGNDKKYDAAKTIWRTQKIQGEVKDATGAFREVFAQAFRPNPNTGDGKSV